jgi:glycosyltransferase involved in cell wall biosynthesis
MKISMVSEHASPLATLGGVDAGGQNVHVSALSAALAARGHEVTVFTRRDDRGLDERVRLCDGVDVVHIDAGPPERIPKDELLPYMDEFGDRLVEHWRNDMPDIAHSHFWMSGLATTRAARHSETAGLPVVHTYHALGVVKRRNQGADDTSPAEREALEPLVGRSVDGVIATCSDEAFELKTLGIPSGRISVVPCGVDTTLFSPNGPREQKGRPFRIMTVGRLVPRKGVGLTISALAQLVAEGRTDIELVILGGSTGPNEVGDDPDVQRLLAHARSLGVQDYVTFRGQVGQAELPAALRSADLVVCAPWYEPFGIVPLEAMATGTPVVAAAVGGLIDSVVHGATGVHVPPRDSGAIADAVRGLLDDPATLASFAQAGILRAQSRYSWSKVASETDRVYRKVLARSASSAHRNAGRVVTT